MKNIQFPFNVLLPHHYPSRACYMTRQGELHLPVNATVTFESPEQHTVVVLMVQYSIWHHDGTPVEAALLRVV